MVISFLILLRMLQFSSTVKPEFFKFNKEHHSLFLFSRAQLHHQASTAQKTICLQIWLKSPTRQLNQVARLMSLLNIRTQMAHQNHRTAEHTGHCSIHGRSLLVLDLQRVPIFLQGSRTVAKIRFRLPGIVFRSTTFPLHQKISEHSAFLFSAWSAPWLHSFCTPKYFQPHTQQCHQGTTLQVEAASCHCHAMLSAG